MPENIIGQAASSILPDLAGRGAAEVAAGETFSRNQRMTLLAIGIGTYALTARVAGPLHIFADPGFGASLALDDGPMLAFVKVAIWTVLVGVAAMFAGRTIRPDVGLFAAAIALLAVRRVGGVTRDVYLQHPTSGAMRLLAIELALLGLLLGAVYAISRHLVARGILRDDAAFDSIRPKPEHISQKLIAIASHALTVGMGILLTCRSDERMQVTVTLAICGILASICVVRFIPATPSVYFWTGPIVIGIVGYLLASFGPVDWLRIGEPTGYAPALVRPLPLDYASAAVAGAIYGYWIARKQIP